jgi:hypothetical protein
MEEFSYLEMFSRDHFEAQLDHVITRGLGGGLREREMHEISDLAVVAIRGCSHLSRDAKDFAIWSLSSQF